LPPEVWAVVAEHLRGDGSISTLASLNRTSWDIHDSTLPVLYETVELETEEDFERSVGFGVPRGWLYTRYVPAGGHHAGQTLSSVFCPLHSFLFVNDATATLLRMHQRYQLHLSGRSLDETRDLRSLFPQLVLLLHSTSSAAAATPSEAPLHITLYRSIHLPTLLSLCRSGTRSYIGHVSLFGSYYVQNQKDLQPVNPFDVVGIIGLTVKKGARIERPPDARDMSRWRPCDSSVTRFLLEMEEDVNMKQATDVVALAMDHLELVHGSKQVFTHPLCLELDMRCNPSTLEQFIDLVSPLNEPRCRADRLSPQYTRRPFFLNLIVHLSGVSIESGMKRYITRLADSYAQIYTPRLFGSEDEDEPFVIIRSRAAAVHQRYRSRSSADWLEDITDRHEGGYSAELVVGRARSWPGSAVDGHAPRREEGVHRDDRRGFTAIISESLLYKGDIKSECSVWERFYPVDEAASRAHELQG
jgi:hypothetical protein